MHKQTKKTKPSRDETAGLQFTSIGAVDPRTETTFSAPQCVDPINQMIREHGHANAAMLLMGVAGQLAVADGVGAARFGDMAADLYDALADAPVPGRPA